MAKLISLVLGLLLVYWILKSYRRKVDRKVPPSTAGGEDMVRCAQCGLHLPRSESLVAEGKSFCGAEHQRLYQKSG